MIRTKAEEKGKGILQTEFEHVVKIYSEKLMNEEKDETKYVQKLIEQLQ